MGGDEAARVIHRWDLTEAEARALQRELAGKVERVDRFGEIGTVGGIDLGFPRDPAGAEIGRAALVVLRLPELELVERQVVERPVSFPYIPGLLSFREAPVGLAAFAALAHPPDLLLVDGHGIAHPRRFGIACHLGVLLDLPTIGCAKSVLVGRAEEPGPEPGSWMPLVHREGVIGAALRTRPRTNPLYISTGHRVSLDSAIDLVMRCARGYRLPEPTRLADRIASRRGSADA
ncbi:MAG: deoxyribonuclease V [Chloroflexota bacterium]|nr:deoxyribonuclease V [Chloroflexota bacterium]